MMRGDDVPAAKEAGAGDAATHKTTAASRRPLICLDTKILLEFEPLIVTHGEAVV
jgi:hypothetical protein